MKALVAGNTFDETRAQALVNEKTAALMAQSPEVITALASFYNSLSTEQQQKVRDYMDGRGHWFSRG
jgi:periplasmic protein CpxP/Spy